MCQAMRTTITVTRTAPATMKYRPRTAGSRLSENRADLQADEDEGQDVQHEDDRLPHGVGGNTDPRGRALGRRSRHGDGEAHHRQHPGKTESDQRRSRRRTCWRTEERSRSVRAAHDRSIQEEPRKRRTHDDAAGHREKEGWRNRCDGEAVCCHRPDREPIDQERARIIEEAFSFEDRQEAMGRSQLTEYGSGSGGVGWRDDRAERDRRCP